MSAVEETDQKAEKPEGKPKKKRNAFSSPSGDRVRAEYRRSGLLDTLIAGALGGAAYGVHRGADKFLPAETRRALEDTERIFGKLQRTKALSGDKLNPDDVIEAYVTQASRLSTAPIAGMQGREFVKLLRSKIPSDHPWRPHYSDAHYDAFARGPAYAAAQLIDEKAEEMAKTPAVNEKLRKYLALKWPDKFSKKVNDTAVANGVSPMDVGPSLRESLAYNGVTMPKEKQLAIAKDIISGDRFNKDRIPLLGGFADRYAEVKKNLSNGLMTHSFPNYVGLGHKARGVHKALSITAPAILGAAGVGVGGYGLYKLIKSLRRTAYEKRMMEKADREGVEDDAEEVKKQAAAIGLPDRSNFGDISQLKEGDLLDLIVQEHRARRAGTHFDVRLGDPDRELFSWATRKGLPDVPGRAHQLFRQPLHTYGYKDFEGEIPEGYGAGTVKKVLEQKVLTTRSDEGGISFTGPKGDRFRFTKQNGNWIVTKAKPLKPPGHLKEHMKSVAPEDVSKLDIQSAEPKIDGALHLMRLGVDPELLSHRISKRHGGPIVHTERVFGGRPKLDAGKIPAELRAAELLGEVYAQRKGKMLTPEELGGLLNSDLDKSIAKQRAENIKMRLALHGISGDTQPRDKQRQLLAQVAALLPDTLEVTPEVKGRENALKLLERVRSGKHPLTHEGVIIHTPDGPRKVKMSEESDVYVREPFPGTGRLAKLGLPGGFTYSNTPKGSIIGRVGSGLNDETRAALADYIGRVARVKHHGVGAKGALKKPSFTALHEDYPTKSAGTLARLRKARNVTHTHPTEGQTVAGNYRKGTFKWNGLNIKIENPEGSTRRGVSKDGKAWANVMQCDYGYFAGNGSVAPKGRDGDAIDVFVGPNPDSDVVVVIDQMVDGKFDEHKVVIGIEDEDQACKLYLSNYQKGWKCGPTTVMNVQELKAWLNSGDKNDPIHQSDKVKKIDRPEVNKKASAIADWMRGDDKGLDWRWGLLGSSLVGLPVDMATNVYTGNVIPRVAGAPQNLNERRLYRSLLDSAKGLNVNVVPPNASKTQMHMSNQTTLSDKIRSLIGRPQKSIQLRSSLYNPLHKEVVLVKGMKAPGVLAHELGHAAGGKGMIAANVIGKQGLGIATLLSLLSRDKEDGKRGAMLGTALGGAILTSELDASRRGYRMLRDLGSGRKAALKAFIGIPTYLAATATPLLAHHTKSRMGGYDTEKRAAKWDKLLRIGDLSERSANRLAAMTADRSQSAADKLMTMWRNSSEAPSELIPLSGRSFGLRDIRKAMQPKTLLADMTQMPHPRDRVPSPKTIVNYLRKLEAGTVRSPADALDDIAEPQVKNLLDDIFKKKASDDADEPSAIGKGLGTLFSDFFPFAPSGARRAGAASLMSERLGRDPGLLLKYPMLSQILAAAGGGALAGVAVDKKSDPSTTLLAAVAPYLAVQGLKRRKINKIDREYKDTKKRKRLREVNAEGMVDAAMGSHRLGMAQAFEAMRTRKLRDIGAIAEAGDALPVATTMIGLGPAASLPLTQLIDHLEAGRFREKKAGITDQVDDSWTDQVNAPTIPLYLAAAGAGLGGLVLSGKKFHNDLNDPNLKSMPRSEWDGLLKHVAGRDLLSAQVPGLNNAFFARAKNDDEARSLLGYALHDPRVLRRLILNPSGSKMIDQMQDHGTAMFDPAFGKASVIGHEAGHAKIEHTPGILQSLQRKLYHLSPVIAPFSAVGGMAAGLASKSPLGGLLAGTGIGLIGGAGMMLPEYMATRHGMKGLETYQGGKWKQDGDWKRQLTALATYGSLNVLPSSLAGLLGGYIGKRRARKKQEEAEQEVREASENPDNVTRMDESARNSEKAASIQQTYRVIQQAKQIAKQMGRDSADRFIVKHTGSYLGPTIKQFYNHKDAIAAGIKKGMKDKTILEILKNLTPPPTV